MIEPVCRNKDEMRFDLYSESVARDELKTKQEGKNTGSNKVKRE